MFPAASVAVAKSPVVALGATETGSVHRARRRARSWSRRASPSCHSSDPCRCGPSSRAPPRPAPSGSRSSSGTPGRWRSARARSAPWCRPRGRARCGGRRRSAPPPPPGRVTAIRREDARQLLRSLRSRTRRSPSAQREDEVGARRRGGGHPQRAREAAALASGSGAPTRRRPSRRMSRLSRRRFVDSRKIDRRRPRPGGAAVGHRGPQRERLARARPWPAGDRRSSPRGRAGRAPGRTRLPASPRATVPTTHRVRPAMGAR